MRRFRTPGAGAKAGGAPLRSHCGQPSARKRSIQVRPRRISRCCNDSTLQYAAACVDGVIHGVLHGLSRGHASESVLTTFSHAHQLACPVAIKPELSSM